MACCCPFFIAAGLKIVLHFFLHVNIEHINKNSSWCVTNVQILPRVHMKNQLKCLQCKILISWIFCCWWCVVMWNQSSNRIYTATMSCYIMTVKTTYHDRSLDRSLSSFFLPYVLNLIMYFSLLLLLISAIYQKYMSTAAGTGLNITCVMSCPGDRDVTVMTVVVSQVEPTASKHFLRRLIGKRHLPEIHVRDHD